MADPDSRSRRRRGGKRGSVNLDSQPGTTAEAPGPAQVARVLLAKLLSALLGTLLGLFAANFINWQFTSNFTTDLATTQRELVESSRRLIELEPEYARLKSVRSRAQTQLATTRDSVEKLPRYIELLEMSIAGTLASGSADENELLRLRQELKRGAMTQSGPEREWAAVELDRARSQLPEMQDRSAQADENYTPVGAQYDELGKEEKILRDRVSEQRGFINLLNLLSVAVIAIFTLLGYLIYPLTQRWLARVSTQWTSLGTLGGRRGPQMMVGFLGGTIIALVILLGLFTVLNEGIFASPGFRLLLSAFLIITTGVSGALIGVSYFAPAPRRTDPYRQFRVLSAPKILDSSVLIDGRISEVANTGFLEGALIITNSVLRELQNLADNSDGRKRGKGRRGLELVQAMQEDPRLDLRVFDDSEIYENGRSTDEQLIAVARAMGGVVVSNDYNLNRVAAIRDVRVMNFNGLATAIKTRHVPGDLLEIEILDRGKQRGQGVGYLEDGTMVVIEDGEPFLGTTRTIKVTSVTQTQQGRLVFGRADLADEEGNP